MSLAIAPHAARLSALVPALLDDNGCALVPGVLTVAECESVALRAQPSADSVGNRCLLAHAWCAALAARLRRHSVLAVDAVAVQCTYFEKSADRNWLVSIHQDLSIAVAEPVADASLQGWSHKDGSLFVQAPVPVLEQMLAVRLHLDACTADDGPLRVVPGSHRRGRLTPDEAVRTRAGATEVSCVCGPGDVVAMRPLLLHASSKSTGNSRRRVLHFLYGPRALTHGLRWHTAV